ncbi:MAG: RNA recognition motif domain-containing protein [Cyanophyceae cyanobacterium]
MSVRLYVGNLPKEVERTDLETLLKEGGELTSTKLITDHKTGKCRGFAFVTVPDDAQAESIIAKFNGYDFNESKLKVEKASPRSEEAEGNGAKAAKNNRRSGTGKKRRGSATLGDATASAQPDPRWAGELSKLKDLLATQTASS